MRFQVSRAQLLDAVTLVSTVVPPRSIKPILQNVRLLVDPVGVTLLATDLEVAVRYRLEVGQVTEGGDLLLPVNKLVGILRESVSDTVTVEASERSVNVRAGKSHFRILSEDPDEFPGIPSFTDEGSFSVDREAFRTLIRKTSFAAAREKSRYAFNGVRLEVEGDKLRMIGTDGKKMAVKTVTLDSPAVVERPPVIPIKGLSTMERVLSSEDPKVRLLVDDKQVIMRSGRAEVATRLVEGAFPRYENVIPKETPLRITIEKEALARAFRQAAVLTNEESKAVRMTIEDGQLVLSSRAADVGESKIEEPIQYEGEVISTAFNPDYVLEGLKVMDAEQVKFCCSGKDTPARIDGEENYIFIVMPVTLRSG